MLVSMKDDGADSQWSVLFFQCAAGTNFDRFIELGSIGNDLNNDGKPDLLWRNSTTSQNVVFPGLCSNQTGCYTLINDTVI